MSKNIFKYIVGIMCVSALLFTSCFDDDKEDGISESWKSYQKKLFDDASSESKYPFPIASNSGNGTIYYTNTDSIGEGSSRSITPRIGKDGFAYANDTVVFRYRGWYYREDGTRIVFSSTEIPNKPVKFTCIVNKNFTYKSPTSTTSVSSPLDGISTMLQNMKVGEEVEVCIPHALGYGVYGGIFNNEPISGAKSSVYGIEGFTTLFFTIKLLEIKPVNKNEVWD